MLLTKEPPLWAFTSSKQQAYYLGKDSDNYYDFITKIQNAKFIEIDSNGNENQLIEGGEPKITWKRENINENEFLDIVTLPANAIKMQSDENLETLDIVLFIRYDDYGIFKTIRPKRRSIVNGNPGISKSWFQWKYILFLLRPDIHSRLIQGFNG